MWISSLRSIISPLVAHPHGVRETDGNFEDLGIQDLSYSLCSNIRQLVRLNELWMCSSTAKLGPGKCSQQYPGTKRGCYMDLFSLRQAQTRESIYFLFLVDHLPCRKNTASSTETDFSEFLMLARLGMRVFPETAATSFRDFKSRLSVPFEVFLLCSPREPGMTVAARDLQ